MNDNLQNEVSSIPSETKDMKGVYISTYGCQMNVNDTERMYSLLEMQNYTPVSSPELADLILINSCSVREKPVHKVYSEVGKFRKLKDKNPNLKIGVGGCVGQQEKDSILKNSQLVDFVFCTDNIDLFPSLVSRSHESKERFVEARFQHRNPYHVETLIQKPGVSTFINITKGCDNFCTFCVVPYTRGREKSRPMSHVVDDVRNLIKRGVREVTLLGQNVNSYKSECGAGLAELLEELATKTDITRIRFTTSHPKDFDKHLTETMYRNQPKVCEYIHLPIQSGNSRVLEAMNRGYTREQYLEKIKMIKEAMPNVVFSTDIIVGFPGETEEEFQDTISLVQEVGFETIYAFKYSPRPFTKAARFENQVPENVKEDRLDRLFKAHDGFAMDMMKNKYEGQVVDVLVEQYDDVRNNLSGRSSENKNVYFLGSKDLVGQMVKVKINKAFPATFRGELIQ